MQKVLAFIYFLIISSVLLFSGCGSSGGGSSTSSTNSGGGQHNANSSAPIITLKGNKKIALQLGEVFTDPGVEAIDDIDGDISSLVSVNSNVDYSKAGNYTITYTVRDSSGNETTIKRDVDIFKTTDALVERSGLVINEIMASNASTNLDPEYKSFSDWIELHNNSSSSIDISGYYLSDDEATPQKWSIPSGTTLSAGQYLIIWLDKEDKGLHTNFSLNSDGETITLYDKSGFNVIDSIKFGKQKSNISCAKMDDTLYYMIPSPGYKNATHAITPSKRSKKPAFSQENGFYTNSVTVELSQINNGEIYYTTDGSIPTKNSIKYTNPILITDTTVIRTRSYDGNFLPSKINTHTYLINENSTLPVVSISVDNKYLYDDKIGIYTLGTDENGNTNDSTPSKFRETNYGRDWERPASFEYFYDKKPVISENVGIKIHGRYSRAFAQKSFNIYARGKYDNKYIKYPLFPNKPNITKVKSFTLRNSGGDWGHTMFRDAMTQSLIKDTMSIDYQDYQPAILFLNGKYWGIQNIRERSNGELIRSNHNIKTKNIDLLAKTVTRQEIYEGDNADYAAMIEYIEDNDISNPTNYNYILTKMDMDNYMEYMITEMFIGSDDWPLNNNKYWRERSENGKWRWILFDTDSGFWNYKKDRDPFEYLLNPSSGSDQKNTAEATFLFRSLMKNSTFKNNFLAKFQEHLSTTFSVARIKGIIDNDIKRLEPEIERHINRWSSSYNPENHRATSKDQWLREVDDLKSFAESRVPFIKQLISQQ